MWASQFAFKKLGRAMLYPLFRQKYAKSSCINEELRLALQWWCEVLRSGYFAPFPLFPFRVPLLFFLFILLGVLILFAPNVGQLFAGAVILSMATSPFRSYLCELRPWSTVRSETVHLLCDARSTPPRVSAVAAVDGQLFYSDAEPPACVMAAFQPRGDGQITSLEILAIAFGKPRRNVVNRDVLCHLSRSGLSTFAHRLCGRNVHIHSDNTGAQHCTSKGRAKTFDHTCLVHGIWCEYVLQTLTLCCWCALLFSGLLP